MSQQVKSCKNCISVPLPPSSRTGQLTDFSVPFRTVCSNMSPCIRACLLVMIWAVSMEMAHGNAAMACSNGSENNALIQTWKSARKPKPRDEKT